MCGIFSTIYKNQDNADVLKLRINLKAENYAMLHSVSNWPNTKKEFTPILSIAHLLIRAVSFFFNTIAIRVNRSSEPLQTPQLVCLDAFTYHAMY